MAEVLSRKSRKPRSEVFTYIKGKKVPVEKKEVKKSKKDTNSESSQANK